MRINRPLTLSFDLYTLKVVRNIARVVVNLPTNFDVSTTILSLVMGRTGQTDHVTL